MAYAAAIVQGWAGAMAELNAKLRDCEDELRAKEDCLMGTQESIVALNVSRE